MICVVLDSNVFLSALLFGGNPRKIVELAERGLIRAAVSPPIRGEVERILEPDDNSVLECALAGAAITIVTGDPDLLDLHPYPGISILTPRQFLETRLWDVH